MKLSMMEKYPGMRPAHVNISDRAENLDVSVGGNHSVEKLTDDTALIYNKYGAEDGLEFNCNVMGLPVFGPFMISGIGRNGALKDLPCSWEEMKRVFEHLWRNGDE